MHLLALTAWILCGSAILLAGIEVAAHFHPHIGGTVVVPASDLWAALAPDSYLAFRQALPRGLWGSVLAPVFQAPAWFLVGAPGLILAFLARPRPDAETAELEDSLGLFDRLADEARLGVHDLPPDLDDQRRTEAPGDAGTPPLELTPDRRVDATPPSPPIRK